MKNPFKRQYPTAEQIIQRGGNPRSTKVSGSQALAHSAVWACRRLRADLISTSPIDVYRDIGGIPVELPKPAVLLNPGGAQMTATEWMYSTQADLDTFGNTFGLITARDGFGLPAEIRLLPAEKTTVVVKNGDISEYRVSGQTYKPEEIWHERQYTVAGSPVGLSPIAHAALTISGYLSAQTFSQDWFSAGARPGARLWNKAKIIDRKSADEIKQRFKASVDNGDLFVHGADWDYEMIGAKASESVFLESMQFSIADVARFMGVPGDLIDAESSSGSITYANVTQRNLQFLIMNLGPAIARREEALSRLVPGGRYVKLNTAALVLRMDPLSRAQLNATLLESGQRTLTEVREKDDLGPIEDDVARTVQDRADALGILVKSGFDADAAAAALGMPPIKHTGAIPASPVTIQGANA